MSHQAIEGSFRALTGWKKAGIPPAYIPQAYIEANIPRCFTLDKDSNLQTNFFLLILGMNLYI